MDQKPDYIRGVSAQESGSATFEATPIQHRSNLMIPKILYARGLEMPPKRATGISRNFTVTPLLPAPCGTFIVSNDLDKSSAVPDHSAGYDAAM